MQAMIPCPPVWAQSWKQPLLWMSQSSETLLRGTCKSQHPSQPDFIWPASLFIPATPSVGAMSPFISSGCVASASEPQCRPFQRHEKYFPHLLYTSSSSLDCPQWLEDNFPTAALAVSAVLEMIQFIGINYKMLGHLPCGLVIKNPPVSARDTG